MPIEITIPRLGWSMDEGNFTVWIKKEGELVKAGEPLFTMESEKAAQDIEAADSGILKLLPDGPQAGDVVKVGQVIGHLLGAEESATGSVASQTTAPASVSVAEKAPSPSIAPIAKREQPATQATVSIGPVTPRARRRAAELGVDTGRIQGSGKGGRIIEADVLKNEATPTGVSVMRRAIARQTAESFSSAPHFYLRCEVDATALIRLREDLLPEIESREGVRLTLTDLILRAQAMALKQFPAANGIWLNDDIVKVPGGDVGLVVGLPEGLMIPIVRSAATGDLGSLAKQRTSLVAAARAGKLSLGALQGGATSLSNLGNTRVDEFAAVIAPPQSTMLAVGRAAPRPYVFDGRLAVRSTLRLCLSVDHRVLDGAPAAEFLGLIVDLLETPGKLAQ